MILLGLPEKQTLSQCQRLGVWRFMKGCLKIIAYVRQGKGREKDWQRKKGELGRILSESLRPLQRSQGDGITLPRCLELGHENQAFLPSP